LSSGNRTEEEIVSRGDAKGLSEDPEVERDDLQRPLEHEGAPSERYDGNEGADDRVEVLNPDGTVAPRVPNRAGRSAEEDPES
jgi:hypothetical protein